MNNDMLNFGQMSVGAQRVEHAGAMGFRLVKEPKFGYTLQGCYLWTQGVNGGYVWRDIATVNREDIADEDVSTTQH